MILVSIDPGLSYCGLAVWHAEEGRLLAAKAVEAPKGASGKTVRGPAGWSGIAQKIKNEVFKLGITEPPEYVLVETMRIYTQGRSRPADILELQGVAACAIGALAPRVPLGVEPARWKGQVPREVFSARVEGQVQARGWVELIEAPRRKDAWHDIYHAVGLGSWGLANLPSLLREHRDMHADAR